MHGHRHLSIRSLHRLRNRLRHKGPSSCDRLAGFALRRLHTESLRQSNRRPSADRKSTRLNSSHLVISYAVFCLKKKNKLFSKDRKIKFHTSSHVLSAFCVFCLLPTALASNANGTYLVSSRTVSSVSGSQMMSPQ